MKKILSLLCLAVLLSNLTAYAHTATIENQGENQYKSLYLTPEIYRLANVDLSDLLLQNEQGENLPFFLYSGYEVTGGEQATYPLSLLNSYVKDDAFYLDYTLAQQPTADVPSTALVLTTHAKGFAKKVELFGSYDNLHWEKVQDDSLYSVDGTEKLTLQFNEMQKYTHYRLKLSNHLEPISFDCATLQYNVVVGRQQRFAKSESFPFRIEHKDNDHNTYVYIPNTKNLRLGEITVETDSMFKRTASVLGVQKELYNLTFESSTYTDTSLPLDAAISTEDELVLKIINNDDKPIDITGIQITYYRDTLVFEKQAGSSYTLVFSGDPVAQAPVYDIASYKDKILSGALDPLVIREVFLSAPTTPQAPKDYKKAFDVAIIAITVLLAVLIVYKLKNKEVPKS